MRTAFSTKRLRVFMAGLKPTDHNETRWVFVAFRTDEDRPLVCASCVYFPALNSIDWLEVTSEYRRQGFATEFRDGLVKFLKRVPFSTAGSDDGEAFLEAWCVREEAAGREPIGRLSLIGAPSVPPPPAENGQRRTP